MPGLEGAKIEIHPLNVGVDPLVSRNQLLIAAYVVPFELLRGNTARDLAAPETGRFFIPGSKYVSNPRSIKRGVANRSHCARHSWSVTLTDLVSNPQHLASYPTVERLSHFIHESLPLGPLIVHTSRSVAHSTRRAILRPLRASPPNPESSQPGAAPKNDPSLLRLLHLLDATVAHALSDIDHLVVLFRDAGGKVRHWLVSSASQLRDLAAYLHRTYCQEADKFAGASDIVVFCGAVSFTVAVGAFDVLVYVAEWVFDGRAVREVEMRGMGTAV